MSLTSLLKSPLHSNLTNWLNYHFPYSAPTSRPPLLVGKEAQVQVDYSLVGTAFDYLFRFQLERLNPLLLSERRPWIAEHGLQFAAKLAARQSKAARSALLSLLTRRFEEARNAHQAFIGNGLLTPELLQASLLLAKLDVVYRTGRIDLDFEAEHVGEATQLTKLLQAVDWRPFTAHQQCVLNPTFGRASNLVGGADADVLLDGMLIDLKVTATNTPRREYIQQLIGYYLLSLIHTQNCEPVYPIHTLALYFPRADYLLKIPVADFFDQPGFRQRKIEFIGLVRNTALDLVDWNNNEFLFNDNSSVTYRVDRHDFKCPHCHADRGRINEAGQTSTGRYRYRCLMCHRSFSTVFSAGLSIKSAVQSLLFGYRLDCEEVDCLQQELKRDDAALQARIQELLKSGRSR